MLLFLNLFISDLSFLSPIYPKARPCGSVSAFSVMPRQPFLLSISVSGHRGTPKEIPYNIPSLKEEPKLQVYGIVVAGISVVTIVVG